MQQQEPNHTRFIAELYSAKAKYNNYFNQDLTNAEFVRGDDYIVMRIPQQGDFFRVYFVASDWVGLSAALKSLNGVNVINIPSKGDIVDFRLLMAHSGYESISVYERYYNQKIKQRGALTAQFAVAQEAESIYRLFYNYFDPRIDYLPTQESLLQYIAENQVVVSKKEDKVVGAFIFAFEGKKCYLRAWIDTGENGLKLLFDVYNIMAERQCGYAYFWVNSTNEQVKSIHQLLGARPDGLKDYTFVKK